MAEFDVDKRQVFSPWCDGPLPRLQVSQVPRGIVDAITRVVSDRGEVLDSASPKLGTLRREIKIAHDRLMSRLQKYLTESGNKLQEPIITQRAGRYVVVPAQEAGADEAKRPLPVSVDVADGKTETVTLQPQASGATVRVKAVDARGRPAQGGVVLVAGSGPRPATFSALLESGALFPATGRGSPQVIAGVPPGSYTLFVIEERGTKHPGLYQQSVQVFDNSDLAIEVKLPDGLPALSDPLQARFGTLSPL